MLNFGLVCSHIMLLVRHILSGIYNLWETQYSVHRFAWTIFLVNGKTCLYRFALDWLPGFHPKSRAHLEDLLICVDRKRSDWRSLFRLCWMLRIKLFQQLESPEPSGAGLTRYQTLELLAHTIPGLKPLKLFFALDLNHLRRLVATTPAEGR